jgi:dTDP-4-amino-4,6-dideoxygalactose transaminase
VVGKEASFTREQLAECLEENGVETRTLFSSIPTQCTGFEYLGFKPGQFPNAEYVGRNGLHFGVHQDLGLAEMDYVLAVIRRFLERCQT